VNHFFYLTLRLNGYPIDNARRTLSEIKYRRQKSYVPGCFNSSLLQDALAIYKHHGSNPFYRKLLRENGMEQLPMVNTYEEWLQIPIIAKSNMQRDLDEIIQGQNKKDLRIHNTSGSTGNPFFFAKDKFCHAMNWAMIDDRLNALNIKYGADLQGRFYGIPLNRIKYQKERLKDWISGRYRFPVFDLSDQKMEEILQVFRRKPFVYTNGYASSLAYFAKFLIRKGLILKDVCPTLRLTITTSEVCDDIDRATMEKGFGVPVANEYGAAELDWLAMHDTEGNWLINNETLLVEIIDDNGAPCLPGVEGRVIVTSLFNKAMPFIRYDVGDRAVLADGNKGPYQLMQRVAGRNNDIIRLPSGKVSMGFTIYYLAKELLEKGEVRVKEFIMVQKALDTFEVQYSADQDLTENDKQLLRETLEQYLEPGLHCSFLRKEHVGRTHAGKLKYFRSELEA
jgi:phenylacetate-CoA ligase